MTSGLGWTYGCCDCLFVCVGVGVLTQGRGTCVDTNFNSKKASKRRSAYININAKNRKDTHMQRSSTCVNDFDKKHAERTVNGKEKRENKCKRASRTASNDKLSSHATVRAVGYTQ